ncbi:MAG: hypothetical protein F4Y50_05765 [Dehalococcoidia bacterium]|nr:hypothetical protein [Dehalococcoidia bacterium]
MRPARRMRGGIASAAVSPASVDVWVLSCCPVRPGGQALVSSGRTTADGRDVDGVEQHCAHRRDRSERELGESDAVGRVHTRRVSLGPARPRSTEPLQLVAPWFAVDHSVGG